MYNKKTLEDLALSYIKGELSDKDRDILFDLLRNKDNKLLFDYLIKLDYIANLENLPNGVDSDKAYQKVIRRIKTRKRYSVFFKYAASILILIFSYYAINKSFFDSNNINHIKELKPDNVTLVINNEEVVKLPIERISMDYQSIDSVVAIRNQFLTKHKDISNRESLPTNNYTVLVPNGSVFNITLSDGTKVWLNSESRLSYPEVFNGNKRSVRLIGEGYFEVASLNKIPFYVETDGMKIRVLGTKFNVKSYDYLSTTTLKEGLVSIHIRNNKDSILLNPNEQLVYNKETNKFQKYVVNVNDFMSWKNNRIIIRNSLDEIFNELSRLYKFEVSYSDDSLRKIIFHLDVERYPSINQVIDKIKKTNAVKIEIDTLDRIRVYR